MKHKWLEIAEQEMGQHEVKGKVDNPRIVEYHSTTTLRADNDEVPWCSSFVNWCVEQAGIKGTGSAAAKSWLNWGRTIAVPEEGCICVIKQKRTGHDAATGSTSGYHVAFWLKEEGGRAFLLGGNQADQVKVSSFGLKSYEICGYRMPIPEIEPAICH
ncbi:MAG: TIGR02594 family protein [Gaiellales bacterium]|nr:MAG: TIGR02594 family protein [Gaiellales bacterium]